MLFDQRQRLSYETWFTHLLGDLGHFQQSSISSPTVREPQLPHLWRTPNTLQVAPIGQHHRDAPVTQVVHHLFHSNRAEIEENNETLMRHFWHILAPGMFLWKHIPSHHCLSWLRKKEILHQDGTIHTSMQTQAQRVNALHTWPSG